MSFGQSTERQSNVKRRGKKTLCRRLSPSEIERKPIQNQRFLLWSQLKVNQAKTSTFKRKQTNKIVWHFVDPFYFRLPLNSVDLTHSIVSVADEKRTTRQKDAEHTSELLFRNGICHGIWLCRYCFHRSFAFSTNASTKTEIIPIEMRFCARFVRQTNAISLPKTLAKVQKRIDFFAVVINSKLSDFDWRVSSSNWGTYVTWSSPQIDVPLISTDMKHVTFWIRAINVYAKCSRTKR